MKAFLLAGGLGERLRPLTDHMPKCLAPINGIPLLSIWLDLCVEHGITDVLINISRHTDAVEHFLQRRGQGPNVRLVKETRLTGNAGAVRANRHFVGRDESFFIFYSDNLTNASLDRLLAFHRTHDGVLSMGLFHAPVPRSAGIVQLDGDGVIRAFEEKPQRPEGNLANAGIYVGRQALFDAIPERTGVVDFGIDVFPHLVGRMSGTLVHGFLADIGNPAALDAAAIHWGMQAAGAAWPAAFRGGR
jgi:mannose-1-phosphate guanylyltransferase